MPIEIGCPNVPLLFSKVGDKVGGGGGVHIQGGTFLALSPKGWVLICDRALIRAWAFIQGNTVSEFF